MVPTLKVLSDGEIHRARDLREAAAAALGLSEAARSELLDSGQYRWANRSAWALSYLGRFGAAERPTRGHYRITQQGRELLAKRPHGITVHDLNMFLDRSITQDSENVDVLEDVATELDPNEQIETGVARLHEAVADDLLTRLHGNEPAFFEQAVLDLIMAMGYGGSDGQATRTQLTNDGGIDGVVDQGALGLSRIYVQAKRYAVDDAIGRPAIQAFVGALHGKRANQGVFITTARFTNEARDYANSVQMRVILIDGRRLASLMIQFGVGVQVTRTVRIVKVDEDFFE